MLAEIIHKVAAMGHEDEHNFYPRPSSAGPERCIRQMVYHGLSTPKQPLQGRALLVFDDGHWHEELTNDWIRQTAYQLHSEQMEVDCAYPMRKGHIDGIITDILGVDRLYEHKAINFFTFQKYWNGELPLDYFTQCAIYMDGIQAHINPDLEGGILLIKNKNTAQYLDFEVNYEGEEDILTILKCTLSTGESKDINFKITGIVSSACAKFIQVLNCINEKRLPKRQYDFDHWRCSYCQYGKTCWEGYEKEFKALSTDAMLPSDVEDMVKYYKELGAQKKEIEKEYDSLSKQIKEVMKEAEAREGRAGQYIVKMSLVEQKRLDKSLLSDAEIAKATIKTQYERLFVSQPNEKREAA